MGKASLITKGMTETCPLCTKTESLAWRFGRLKCEQFGLVVHKMIWHPAAIF